MSTGKPSNLSSYCGVYCGGCAWHSGKWRRAARELIHLTDAYPPMPFEGELPFNYSEFLKGLRWLRDERYICPGCRAGGGPPSCDIRACVNGKGFEFCHQCTDFPCEKLERMRKEHPDNIDNIKRIKEIGLDGWLKEEEEKARAGRDIHIKSCESN